MPLAQIIGGGLLMASPYLLRYGPSMMRGGKTLWNLGRGMHTPAGRQAAIDATKRLGQRIYGPGSPAAPGTLPRGPGGRITGPRGPDTPAIPPGLFHRAGPIGRNPIKSSLGLGAAGFGLPYLFEGDPEQPTPEGVPGASGFPGGGVPTAAPFSSDLPSYGERARSARDSYLQHMSTIVKHSMLLSFQNPGRKNSYSKDAVQLLRQAALMNNQVDVANMLDEVFKDKKVPKTAKTIYERMLTAGASPEEAASVSGYTLQMEKAEAKAAADYAKSQPKAKDIFNRQQLSMQWLQEQYLINPEAARQQRALWLKSEAITMPDFYAGHKPKTDEDVWKIAAAMLSGQGTAEISAPSGEIGVLKVK